MVVSKIFLIVLALHCVDVLGVKALLHSTANRLLQVTSRYTMLDDHNSTLVTIALASVILGLFYYLTTTARGPRKLLPLDDFIQVPLQKKEILSHDTRRFTFALPPNTILGLPTGQHISLKFTDKDGKAVQRSYTPTTDSTAVGYFSLVIKVYRPLPPKFPTGGAMSQHLDNLKIGDTILLSGPKGHLHFATGGHFEVKPLGKPKEQRQCSTLAMMAGGTGITPMLQILHAIFEHPTTSKQNGNIQVKLLYANQTPNDILVRDELEDLARRHPDRFSVWYTVDRPTGDWTYDTGFITKAMMEERLLFEMAADTQFFMVRWWLGRVVCVWMLLSFFLTLFLDAQCGPPPMIKFAILPALRELGYSEKDWVVF